MSNNAWLVLVANVLACRAVDLQVSYTLPQVEHTLSAVGALLQNADRAGRA